MDKDQIPKRLEELLGLIKEAEVQVKKTESDLKKAQKAKAKLVKEFEQLQKSTKRKGD